MPHWRTGDQQGKIGVTFLKELRQVALCNF
jgi:hypothetical protein